MNPGSKFRFRMFGAMPPSAALLPDDRETMSNNSCGSMPAFVPSTSPSTTAQLAIAPIIWLTSFTVAPAPTGPTW